LMLMLLVLSGTLIFEPFDEFGKFSEVILFLSVSFLRGSLSFKSSVLLEGANYILELAAGPSLSSQSLV